LDRCLDLHLKPQLQNQQLLQQEQHLHLRLPLVQLLQREQVVVLQLKLQVLARRLQLQQQLVAVQPIKAIA
jgi:hypothetical protein